MNLKQKAQEIYEQSEKLGDKGKRNYYRQQCVKEFPKEDQWILRAHISAIGRTKRHNQAWNRRLE